MSTAATMTTGLTGLILLPVPALAITGSDPTCSTSATSAASIPASPVGSGP